VQEPSHQSYITRPLQNKLRKVPHFSYVAVLERLVNARDDVLAGALEVVTTAQDLVPDTAGCCSVPLEQWVDHSLPPLGVRGVYRQHCFHRGGAGDA
jgi:hypothetical protein